MSKSDAPEREDDGTFHHGCGKTFTHAAWYTKHALKCDGKPVQKRGRIERLAAQRQRRDGKTTQNATAPKPGRRRAVRKPSAAAPVGGQAAREAGRRIAAQLANAKAIVMREVPSCTRCEHAPVCILRARINELAGGLLASANEEIAKVAGDDERPTIRLDVGCSLYLAEAE